jgi:hypothetical protein
MGWVMKSLWDIPPRIQARRARTVGCSQETTSQNQQEKRHKSLLKKELPRNSTRSRRFLHKSPCMPPPVRHIALDFERLSGDTEPMQLHPSIHAKVSSV